MTTITSAPEHVSLWGQAKLRARLATHITTARVPHALLLHGMPGVGKAGIALEFARRLMCEQFDGACCEQCAECHLSRQLRHPDLHLVFPLPAKNRSDEKESEVLDRVSESISKTIQALARDPYAPTFLARGKAKDTTARASAAEDRIRVELVRLMLREAALKPFQSQRKIFVIFHAETMMDTAQNAFLKVLEDPPAHSYFVLVCDNLRELLPTIRSRCQKLLVPPLPPEDLVPALQAGGLAPDVARAIALLAAGSVTRARQLSGADIAVLQSRAIAFMRSAATCDALELPERTKELADTGDLPSDTGLELLSILVRDVATYRGSESADDLTYSAYTDTLRRLIAAYPDANFDEAVCHIDSAAVGIERNLSVDWVYYNLAIQLNRALGARVVVQRT